MKTRLIKNIFVFLLFSIIILAFVLRFYKLGAIPLGLNKDETAIGYNAYSILETGKDEYGKSFPLYFRSFDDYKLPVYIYMVSGSEKLFGVTPFAVRFPSALFGTLSVLAIFLLVRLLSENSPLSLISALFLALNPWHLFFSRVGSEVNVATAFALFGTVFFVYGCKKGVKFLYILLSLIFFAVSLYCYNVTRIFVPLLVFALTFYYRQKLRKISLWKISVLLIVCIVILLPFIITLFSNSGFQNQQGSVLLTGNSFHAKALEFRSYLPPQLALFSKIIFSSYIFILWQFILNIVGFFSVNFYFLTGAQNPINGVVNMGMFNLVDVFFMLTGLFIGIAKKKDFLSIFFLWALIVVLVGSITNEVPHPTRSYLIIIPLIVFSAYGAYSIWKYLLRISPKIRVGSIIIIVTIFLYSSLFYITSYFFRFPSEYAKAWRSQDRNVAQFVAANAKNYDKIVFDTRADFSYTSFLFYTKFPPRQYILDAHYTKDGLLNTLKQSGKYEFHQVDWKKEYPVSEKVLFITSPNGESGGVGVLKTFYYLEKPVVNIVNNSIVSYPYSEPAYVAIETVSSYEKNR